MKKLYLTENQSKVLAVLYYNKKFGKDYMSIEKIKEECGFEKSGTVVGCLQGLGAGKLVEVRTQELLDGSLQKFYYIPNPIFNALSAITTFEMEEN